MCERCATDTEPTRQQGREFRVAGMSCQPCAATVNAAVRAVPGVDEVVVDLAGGRITVTGGADESAIRAAVSAAGYSIANP